MIDHARAHAMELTHEPVPAEQVVAGHPRTATAVIGSFGSQDYGVWEMTPGVMNDVEEDEVFIVLGGLGTIRFLDSDELVTVESGFVGCLTAGARTEWTVSETLRKVWIS